MRERHAAMPCTITAYRGHAPDKREGLYYTTERSIAEWFAGNIEHGMVTTRVLQKKDCWYVGGPQSSVIYVPELVPRKKEETV